MTIQEYKEKIIHTIEEMEMEHGMNVERVEITTDVKIYDGVGYTKRMDFKMDVR